MKPFQLMIPNAIMACLLFGPLNCFAGEIMTDRCSADVSFPSTYNGPPTGANSGEAPAINISRANADSTHWTSAIRQAIDSDGHIRWWRHSTTGNRADPGTYVVDGAGVTYSCGDSEGNQDCKPSPKGIQRADIARIPAGSSECLLDFSIFDGSKWEWPLGGGPNRPSYVMNVFPMAHLIKYAYLQ